MNTPDIFYKSVFYESIGLKELYDVYEALSNLSNYKVKLTEKSTSNRTIDDDVEYLNKLVGNVDDKIRTLNKARIDTVRQSIFNSIEDLIQDILFELEKIVKRENEANHDVFQNIVVACETSINALLQRIWNEIQRNHLQITHKTGKSINQNDFQLQYYLNLFNIHIALKNEKNKSNLSK